MDSILWEQGLIRQWLRSWRGKERLNLMVSLQKVQSSISPTKERPRVDIVHIFPSQPLEREEYPRAKRQAGYQLDW